MASVALFPQGRKSTRSCIFSGSSRLPNSVATLHSIAFNIVGKNILCYRDLPANCFESLKPILAKLAVTQLRQFLAFNPDLIDNCDSLYRTHCYAEFKYPQSFSFDDIIQKLCKSKFGQANPNVFQDGAGGWSQLCELLQKEQNFRLKQINDSIGNSIRMGKQNERKTVLIDASRSYLNRKSDTHPRLPPRIHTANRSTLKGAASIASLPAKPIAPLMRKCLGIKKRYNTLLK